MILASAAIAGGLLFFNGGLMMAVIDGLREAEVGWARGDQFAQFLVLIGPVLMLVMQWWMLDYLRGSLARRVGRRDVKSDPTAAP